MAGRWGIGEVVRKIYSLLTMIGLLLASCSKEEQTVSNTEEWKESSTLVREVVITDDGKTDDFIFRIGDNGKLGFGEYGPFIAGKPQKHMWHFWGEKEVLTKPFKVVGVSKKTREEMTVFEFSSNNVLAPNSGADHHIPSTMTLPSEGVWKLEAYFGEELFGNVIVNVTKQ